MKLLTVEHLNDLARGAIILGSGGGGAPSYNQMITQQMIEKFGPIEMICVDELSEEDVVAPLAFMGAPLVALEKLPSGREFDAIFSAMPSRPTVLTPAEIGGANAFTPLWVAAKLKIPVLDGDTIGRAFPEVQMSVCTIEGIKPYPAYLSDSYGNVIQINHEEPGKVENLTREVTISMGSRAAIAIYIMTGKEAKRTIIPGTISKAIELGKEKNLDSITSGVIVDVDHCIRQGFLCGTARLRTQDGEIFYLDYRNEFLRVRHLDKSVALTPDIIALIEQDTGIPITTSNLQYGLRVNLIVLDAPSIWKTPIGMDLVGPKVFGYE